MSAIKINKTFILITIMVMFSNGCASIERHGVVSAEYIYKYSPEEARLRIDKYLKDNPNVDKEKKEALLKLWLIRGMTKEQVLLVAGRPNNISSGKEISEEIWFYNLGWSGVWGSAERYKLTFKNDILIDIEKWWLESP